MKKGRFVYVVISGLLCSFAVLALTGAVKYKRFYDYISSYVRFPLGHITTLHEWSALLFVLFLFIHLLIQRDWFIRTARILWENMRYLWVLLLFIMLVLVGYLVFDRVSRSVSDANSLRELAAVEVREYKGEDLSSLLDFRENSIKGVQYLDIDTYTLSLSGLVDTPLEFSYDDVLNRDHYEKVVTLHCVEGWDATILWEGVLLSDLLAEVGVQEGASTVVFEAYDGYSSSLPLAYIRERNILLAFKMNGVVLPPQRGFPFQVIAEDKWGYKWVKWVTGIRLIDDSNYKGYWERSGYSNDADVTGPKLGE